MSQEICETQKIKFIPYPEAFWFLEDRLNATLEEMAAWVYFGPADGGLSAYLNANELAEPLRFYYDIGLGEESDYIAPLMQCWFIEDEIREFHPTDRYITGAKLLERWSKLPGISPKAYVCSKIQESRLNDHHPFFGGTVGSTPNDESYPPLESGLFLVSEIEEIERSDFDLTDIQAITDPIQGKWDLVQTKKPWLIPNHDDPSPIYDWYTPARYFARKLISEDVTLLTKRDILAKKVANALKAAGISKRGGKKPFDPATVKKAFTKVALG